ncbi:MAG: hypothetical protein ACYS47_18920 [Planctomycetota bacterium]|jgi:hypothetical protein
MSPVSQDENEPEPMDPKAASRIIKKHIQRKRATEKRTRDATPEPSSTEEGESASTPDEAPSPPPEPDFLKAVLIRNRDLVVLMEHSPESLMDDWVEVQTGDHAERAVPVSLAEMEFLLLKRNLLD